MSNNEHRQYLLADNLRAIAVSFLTVVFVSVVLGLLMFSVIKEHEEARAEDILSNVRMVFKDAEASLDYLIANSYYSCSEDNLNEMRRTLFRSRFVKEIGFFGDGKLLCSTYLDRCCTIISHHQRNQFLSRNESETRCVAFRLDYLHYRNNKNWRLNSLVTLQRL